VIALGPYLNVIAVLARTRSNDSTWQQHAVDLTSYAGQSFYIYFNVFNNDNSARTWMYVDDVELYSCGAAVPQPQVLPPTANYNAIPPTLEVTPTFVQLPSPTLPPSPTILPSPTALPPSPTPLALIVEPTVITVTATATPATAAVVVLATPPASVTPSSNANVPVTVDVNTEPVS